MEFKVVFEFLICSIITGSYFIFSGHKIFNQKINFSGKNILVMLGLIVFLVFNYMFLDNVIKVITVYTAMLFTYKMLFRKNFSQSAIAALVSYLIIIISEILFITGIMVLCEVGVISDVKMFIGTIFANFCISTVAAIASTIFSKTLSQKISKVKENYKFTLIFTFIVLLLAIGSLFYKMNYDKWIFNYPLILNVIIVLCLVALGFFIIKQHIDKLKIADDYEKYIEYSKETEKLVERYSISQHENKNELIIIRSMVHKNNTRLLEYLDEIMVNKDNITNSWIRLLRYIPFGGLKGIMHNKISNMNDSGINLFFDVSKEVGKSKLKDLTVKENNHLSKIIGVFLDNAKEAALSSKLKEVTINIYVENKTIVFEIANSYDGEINVDNIYNAGYSNKGKNRGYGLVLAKNLVDDNPMFENITTALNGYFVQKLIVKK